MVIEPISSHAYRLDTPPGIHDVFYTSLLRRVATDPLLSQTIHEPQPLAIIGEDGKQEWEINDILRERVFRHRREFFVK